MIGYLSTCIKYSRGIDYGINQRYRRHKYSRGIDLMLVINVSTYDRHKYSRGIDLMIGINTAEVST